MGFCSIDISSSSCILRKKSPSPAELVRSTQELLQAFDRGSTHLDGERNEKMADLMKCIRQMKFILYGSRENEPIAEACSQLTQQFFQDDAMRFCITCLPKLDLEVRKDITQVLANIQRQRVQSRLVVCDYLEANKDLLDLLLSGYENMDIALHYGTILRDCIRHQSIARYVLESDYVKEFFGYVNLPNFEVASDASSTFRELLTRHKSTVSEFLMRNYDWFFDEFNDKLLKSSNYITRRVAVKLLGDILLDRSNVSAMMRYVGSKDNLQVLMDLLREPSKSIQIEAFHVFKVFVSNASKPSNIIDILVANRNKLIRFFSDFKADKEDVQFDEDKAQVVKEIAGLVSNGKK